MIRSKAVYILLAIFLGGLGIHKFYSGHWIQGVVYMLFCWTFIPCIFALFQAFCALMMTANQFDEAYNGGFA